MTLPPGWPNAVRPPDTPDWERSAVNWMLDLCPADYRGHAVLTRHPLGLAYLASRHVDAQLTGLREGRSGVRTALAPWLDPPIVGQLLEVLDVEEARLVAARRAVDLIAQALQGRRYVPRL
jgi:hypothetical protein